MDSSPSVAGAEVVVVTGAAGALGGALVRRLQAGGARVAAIDAPASEPALRALASELGAGCEPYAFDITVASAWQGALSAMGRGLGTPTSAVLAAGGWQGGAPLHEAPDDAVFHAMLRANLETAYQSLRALLPPMVSARRGSVVLVGLRAASRPWTSANAAAYAASKAGVVALAEASAAEVLSSRVRVNAVLPSTLDTRANRRAMPDADPSRWVSLESLAGVIAFLLSDASRDVSGASIPV